MADGNKNKKYEIVGRIAIVLFLLLFGWLIVTLVAGVAAVGLTAIFLNIIPICCLIGLGCLIYWLLKAAGVIK